MFSHFFKILFAFLIGLSTLQCTENSKRDLLATKPLYRDSIYDGAADPSIIWNQKENKWFMFYTNRRANADSLDGVAWVHGTRIGIAESSDGGRTWIYRDTCDIQYRFDEYTHWAPEVVEHNGIYHMYLTYVPGIFTDWNHPRWIVHLTSQNLLNWKFESKLELSSERCIDACVFRLSDGTWRMYYNNEKDGKSIYYADSPDLYEWKDSGKKVVGDRAGEGPNVFHWKGKYWMVVDNWNGIGIYSSEDLISWKRQENNILQVPGSGEDDQVIGQHPDVIINDNKAYIFYFTHPGRRSQKEEDNYETRRSSIQVAELEYRDGQIFCDRDKPLNIKLISCSSPFEQVMVSPEGSVKLVLSNEDHTSKLALLYLEDTIFRDSPLGLEINGYKYTEDVLLKTDTVFEHDESWQTVNGKQSEVRNHYAQYEISVRKQKAPSITCRIIFRVYDDGFAYRYILDSGDNIDSIQVSKEMTRLNMDQDFTYWAYNGEAQTLGPVIRSDEDHEHVRIPVVLKLDKDRYMAIHESEILRFENFSIKASGTKHTLAFNARFSAQAEIFSSSWRTFILGERAGDLAESNLVLNLNEPCKIEDISWIRPGKTLWDWRVWGYVAADGFEYGLNTESHKRFIDFAAANHIQYLLLDADWYGAEFSEDSDPASAREGVDIEACMSYAKAQGIGIFLYLNDLGAKNFGLERVLKQFADWGAVGVKYGFMKSKGHEKIEQTMKIVEMCAMYKLMVIFHDNPVPPGGERRTWPNMLAKEFGYSQADAHHVDFPEVYVNMVLVNSIAGPIDACNGWFGLNEAHSRVKVYEPIPTTIVSELAKPIAIYSGLNVLPDAPEEYAKKDDLFEVFRAMPGQFDSFRILDGVIDEYVSVARSSGDNWFIASLTNRQPRTIEIDFSFLPPDKTYEAILYEDAKTSHYLTNKEEYNIRQLRIDHDSRFEIQMAAGGGNVIHLREDQVHK